MILKATYPKTYFFIGTAKRETNISIFLSTFGLASTFGMVVCVDSTIRIPYSWTVAQSAFYYGFSRIYAAFGIMQIIFGMIIGRKHTLKIPFKIMTMRFFHVFGKLTFICSLILPFITQVAGLSRERQLYADLRAIVQSTLALIVAITFLSFILYLVLEYPIDQLLRLILGPKVFCFENLS